MRAVPPTGDDGCGKEVDQWLAKVVPSKTPAPPPAKAGPNLKPPKAPIMLSELPKECQALLAAEPEPIAIPKDALMTPVQIKKVLAKAAQVNAALASAAGLPGGKTSAAGLAKSPALRPHLRKAATATADPK